ncbi:MAG: AIM24 family protein [Acidimicrobiales bacterium]
MITHKIVGNAMQVAVCQLDQGQTAYAEPGKFLWKTVNVAIETRLTRPVGNQAGAPPAAGGFLQKALDVSKRVLAGEHLAFQYFTPAGGSGLVAMAGVVPGEMRAIELDGTRGWYTEKSTLVAAESGVDFDIAFTGLKAGLRGGEGFVLEHFTGTGTLLLAAAGNFVELNPAKYGGKIQVHTGCIVAFEDSLAYGVERIGGLSTRTAMTAAFGVEGVNLATLEGDGTVLIQSMSLEALARCLHPYLPGGGEEQKGPLGGLL